MLLQTDTLSRVVAELQYLKLLTTKEVGSYQLNLRANARALWAGEWDEFDFYLQMLSTIRRGFTNAFYEGAASCGISPSELSREEAQRLESEIVSENVYIDGLADFISANSKALGGKLLAIYARVDLWVNGYNRIFGLAQTLACGDLKYRWVLGNRKEHCADCKKLNGRVYRGSVWAKYDIYPRHWALACRGVHCGCSLEKTDDPVTPGHPPALTHQKESAGLELAWN